MAAIPTENTKQLDCKQGAVRVVRFNADGNYCLTGGNDRTVKLWNPFRGVQLQSYMGHGGDVMDVRGSCDNASIASVSGDKSVILWDVTTAKSVRKWRGHAGSVQAVCFNEDSSVVFSGSVDGSVLCWDTRSRTRDPLQALKEARDAITSVLATDHEVVSSSLDGCLRRYDLRLGRMAQDTLGIPVTRVQLTRDGLCLLASCLGGPVRLLDKVTGQSLQEFTGHKNAQFYLDCVLSQDDAHVYSGSEDGAVCCWNLVEGKLVERLRHPTAAPVHSLSQHPSKAVLLTATRGLVYLWEAPQPAETADA
ncbi:unnamed protein product [Ixodes persulcatus]